MSVSFKDTLEPKVAENFLHNIELNDTGCWIWAGFASPGPTFVYKGKQRRAQDVAWILAHQTEPEGVAYPTKCENENCVNPEHLSEIVIYDTEATYELIDIDKVTRSLDVQPREYLYEEHLVDYQTEMERGVVFPPVVIFFDSTLYWLADGFHRIEAAERAGLTKIRAHVMDGTKRDAILFSASANTTHGIRRTNADKRRAIIKLLMDEEWRMWSNSKLASIAGVSRGTVINYRRELFRETGDEEVMAQDYRLAEKDGVQYTMAVPQQKSYEEFREDSKERFEKIVVHQSRLADLVRALKMTEAEVIQFAVARLWDHLQSEDLELLEDVKHERGDYDEEDD